MAAGVVQNAVLIRIMETVLAPRRDNTCDKWANDWICDLRRETRKKRKIRGFEELHNTFMGHANPSCARNFAFSWR